MHHLYVLLVIFIGVSYCTTSDNNGTFGESVDGSELINVGRKLKKPMLTLIGMALHNLHPCGAWAPWSPCDASRRGYFGSQTRTRSCADSDNMDRNTMTKVLENKLCEGFCPVRYNMTNNGFCMKLNTSKVSNDVAVAQCKQEGGYLINIDSQSKHDDVKSTLSGFSNTVHIDGRRKDSKSPWEYKYGSTSAFLKWYSGHPKTNADYLCLVLTTDYSYQYDNTCSYTRAFLCEIPNI